MSWRKFLQRRKRVKGRIKIPFRLTVYTHRNGFQFTNTSGANKTVADNRRRNSFNADKLVVSAGTVGAHLPFSLLLLFVFFFHCSGFFVRDGSPSCQLEIFSNRRRCHSAG